MPTPEEKAAFTERLLFSMRRAREKPRGATELAHGFNLRWTGEPVSPQTAHKWLCGRTIPTRDKLEMLAQWLDVDLHWLHYGLGASVAAPVPKLLDRYSISDEVLELVAKFELLNAHQQYIVRAVIEEFYGDTSRR